MQSYTYYGLKLDPFSNTPDNRFYFDSEQHTAALGKLIYVAKAMKGLAVLIGDVGTGKTTLARRLFMSLPEEHFESSMMVIIHSGITSEWLLKKIAMELGVDNPAEEKVQLLGQLYERLVEISESGKSALILIDEAQMLKDRELMEEFRGLLNLELPGSKIISFIFFGLPELEENLKKDEPLNQRVALRYRLGHFNLKSTENYIKHRLKVSGAKKMLFTKEAVEMIQIFSSGVPRVINNICDNALLEGMLNKADIIGREIIRKVAGELGISPTTREILREIESQKVTPVSIPPEFTVTREDDIGAIKPQAPQSTPATEVKEVGGKKGIAASGGHIPETNKPPVTPRSSQVKDENIDIDDLLDSLEID